MVEGVHGQKRAIVEDGADPTAGSANRITRQKKMARIRSEGATVQNPRGIRSEEGGLRLDSPRMERGRRRGPIAGGDWRVRSGGGEGESEDGRCGGAQVMGERAPGGDCERV